MRVISGKARGAKLRSVPGQSTRPTADRVKEALFNILGPSVRGSSFLDLFAGNGGIGLEALSREAREVVWIDSSSACTAMIRANLEKTHLAGGEIFTNDVFRAIVQLDKAGRQFDFVFLDPPYERGFVAKVLAQLAATKILKSDGLVVVEAGKKEEGPLRVSNLSLIRTQNYGDTILYFYQLEEAVE